MALPSEYGGKELRITLRPAADCSRFWMNLSAVLQVTGGSIAVVAAYGVEGATFGLATPAAIALGFWGADQTYAGMKTLVNQTPSTTALGEIFELAGVSPDYSEMVAGLLPIGPSALKGAVSIGLKSSALRSIDVQVVKQGGQIVIDRLSFIATKTRERFTFRRIANKKVEKEIASALNELTIASNPATGNPAAIYRGWGKLNTRQQNVLAQLEGYNSQTITLKNFGNRDLAALSAATGDEFAMFSVGGRRLIIRGNATSVPININRAKELSSQGWRWSSHTHPDGSVMSSVGDRAILGSMGEGVKSVIYNPEGKYQLFNQHGDLLINWRP